MYFLRTWGKVAGTQMSYFLVCMFIVSELCVHDCCLLLVTCTYLKITQNPPAQIFFVDVS